jgi:hypothetical protein
MRRSGVEGAGQIDWFCCDRRALLLQFTVQGVYVANPLEGMHASRAGVSFYEMQGRVVPPYDGVVVISEITRKPQNISVEGNRDRDIWHMQDR